jgi:hypothetical protein
MSEEFSDMIILQTKLYLPARRLGLVTPTLMLKIALALWTPKMKTTIILMLTRQTLLSWLGMTTWVQALELLVTSSIAATRNVMLMAAFP